MKEKPTSEELAILSQGRRYVCLSSRDKNAIGLLRDVILSEVRIEQQTTQLFIPYKAQDIFPEIYAHCRVTGTDAKKNGLLIDIEGNCHVISKIKNRLREVYNG